ncbi:MAG: transcriptional regulator [Nocardia sp.]|uniref:TetR/AcrR family transcriptional regulator n=1 Tax=Nocardia sp. TaxID=1821 RepID=UPI0026335669|nr:TetR/AcrR family transcriptional regulator [Nocardia sp.]MCU1639984.1 transcriptional regulator [Nocardia sp.]
MNESAVRPRPGGRSARVREAVFDAAVAVLAEQGPAGFTVGEVARRAGVHETSIYRRWGTREGLAVEALLDRSRRELPIPDTGSLREDLAAYAAELIVFLRAPLGRALMHTLTMAADNPTVVAARDEFWAGRFELAGVMVERAVARGEVPEGTDSRSVLELLIAPLHFRMQATGEPLGIDLADHLADLVVRAFSLPLVD